MVERDVVLGKVAAIERSLGRIHQVRAERHRYPHPGDVEELIVLNLQRAAQAAVDLAAHVVTTEGYGLPSSLAEAFTLLEKNGVIDADLAARMRRMVGFRNIAVHQYEQVDPAVVEAIVERHLDDLRVFAARVAARFGVGG
jgi:uncharacterized protein YutE (UPF0331/DUF86 family)